MPNGSFLSYKRRRTRKKKDLAWRGRSAAEPISELLSLSLSLCSCSLRIFCSIAYPCRFRGGSRCPWNAPSASSSTSDLLPVSARRVIQGSASVRRPVRFRCIRLCPTVGCNIWRCYFLSFISTYSLVVFICIVLCSRSLCLLGRVPVQ